MRKDVIKLKYTCKYINNNNINNKYIKLILPYHYFVSKVFQFFGSILFFDSKIVSEKP